MCVIASGVPRRSCQPHIDVNYHDRERLTNSECTIENAGKEADTVIPSSRVFKVSPNKGVASMLGWHSSNHNYGHDPSANDQSHAHILQVRDEPVEKDHKDRAEPGDGNENNVRVPRFYHVIRVVIGVHLYNDICGNRNHRSHVEDPAKEVEGATEEANATTP